MTTRRLCRTILARTRSAMHKHPDAEEAVDFLFIAFFLLWVILTADLLTIFRKPKKPTRADWERMAKEERARHAIRVKRGLA